MARFFGVPGTYEVFEGGAGVMIMRLIISKVLRVTVFYN
jgi:hypothetical protein